MDCFRFGFGGDVHPLWVDVAVEVWIWSVEHEESSILLDELHERIRLPGRVRSQLLD
jgi:hypothetical protein